jgi:hypothetical protein
LQKCEQGLVNIAVGFWWGWSLLISLILVLRIEPPSLWPDEEEPLLEEDQASPVGYKVPSLPDFPIDPILEQKAMIPWLHVKVEFVIGVLMAFGISGAIVYSSFSDYDESLRGETYIEEADGLR